MRTLAESCAGSSSDSIYACARSPSPARPAHLTAASHPKKQLRERARSQSTAIYQRKPHHYLYKKIDVNEANAHPLYCFLKSSQGIDSIEWNFFKFLVYKNGRPVKAYRPDTYPKDVEADIEKFAVTSRYSRCNAVISRHRKNAATGGSVGGVCD